MIIRRVGAVLSFRLSPRILWAALIFLLIYLPVSVYIINHYFDLRSAIMIQANMIRQEEQAAAKSRDLIQRSREKISFLEDYLHNLEAEGRPAKTSLLDPESLNAGRPGFAQGGVAESDERRQGPPQFVDIQDLAIRRQEAQVTIQFKLVNVQSGASPAGGYVHLIALDTSTSPSKEWASPREALQDGFPTDYRRGMLFLIKNHKLVHGRFDISPDGKSPAVIKVLVYNHAGQLLLEREFEVRHAS